MFEERVRTFTIFYTQLNRSNRILPDSRPSEFNAIPSQGFNRICWVPLGSEYGIDWLEYGISIRSHYVAIRIILFRNISMWIFTWLGLLHIIPVSSKGASYSTELLLVIVSTCWSIWWSDCLCHRSNSSRDCRYTCISWAFIFRFTSFSLNSIEPIQQQ